MAKKRPAAKRSKKSVKRSKPRAAARRAPAPHALTAPMKGAEHRDLGHVVLDVVRTGEARVKRLIYPVGFHWEKDMKPVTKTDHCMHAHVGFLAQGEIHIEYADGCVVEFKAPAAVAIDPGHDGWVVGKTPAVMIEFDFEGDTIRRLGMPQAHKH